MPKKARPRLWLTYAWIDKQEGDFSFLVGELDGANVEVRFDKVALVPGQRLWDQIGKEIIEGSYDGWAYLLTPNSIASEPCREELAYALSRALNAKGARFPLLGLLHGVRIEDVPPALRVRLCVSLASPDWKEEVRAGLEARPPRVPRPEQSNYIWKVHDRYGQPPAVAVEVRPRFGEMMYWRFALPESAAILQWGHGPADGGAISSVKTSIIKGRTGEVDGTSVKWFGSGDRLSPGISAYVVFGAELPDRVYFGPAAEPFGPPGEMETLKLH